MAIVTSAVVALLGGTGFRLLLGYAMDRLKDWQDHSFEIARMKLDQLNEAAKSKAHIEVLEAQKRLGITTIGVEKPTVSFEDLNFIRQVEDVRKPTGFKWLDMWNSAIRPILATVCIALWVSFLWTKGWILGDWDLELIAATLGIFIGSRISHTGK